MSLNLNPTLTEALRLAALGYRVFPCVPGEKRPLTAHGLKDATTDPDQIRDWWRQHPRANLALCTDGLIVIDCDSDPVTHEPNPWMRDDMDEWMDFALWSPFASTPRGGTHHVFRQPWWYPLRNTTSKLAPRVDTRANGGYILVYPSRVGAGEYTWLTEDPWSETEMFVKGIDRPLEHLCEPPEWVIDALVAHDQMPCRIGPPDVNWARTEAEDRGPHSRNIQENILRAIERGTYKLPTVTSERSSHQLPPTSERSSYELPSLRRGGRGGYEQPSTEDAMPAHADGESISPRPGPEERTGAARGAGGEGQGSLPSQHCLNPISPRPGTPARGAGGEGNGSLCAPDESASIPEGMRHDHLVRYAGQMRRFGASRDEILAALRQRNQERCTPPLPDDEVRNIANSISRYPQDPHSTNRVDGTADGQTQRTSLKRTDMANVTAEPVEWLWPGRIPLGKLTLFAGDPNMGKSMLSMDIAARTSRGDGWPDHPDFVFDSGHTLFMNCEDDLGDTVRPRLDRAGANPHLVTALEYVHYADDSDTGKGIRTFDLNRDLTLLQSEIIATPNLKLLVIDPISAYCGDTDSHRNTDVRGMLAPLDELARRHNIAVILVTHMSKNCNNTRAIYRSMGSLAFTAAARTAWLIDKDPKDETRRLFVPTKFNCGVTPSALAYRITKEGHIEWDDQPVLYTADELVNRVPGAGPGNKERTRIVDEWLREFLSEGPRESGEVVDAAKQRDITFKQLEKARGRIGVRASKSPGHLGKWTWSLPLKDYTTWGESVDTAEVPF